MSIFLKVDKLKNVNGAVVAVDFKLLPQNAGDCTLALAADGLVLKGQAVNTDRVITVTGDLICALKGVCDRCGKELDYSVTAEFSEAFTNITEKVDEDPEGDDAKAVHFFSGDEIDLLPYAEQTVFLSQPMKTLCSEDCKGLCPQCGTNLNDNECSCDKSPIDPRFAVLADLLNKG